VTGINVDIKSARGIRFQSRLRSGLWVFAWRRSAFSAGPRDVRSDYAGTRMIDGGPVPSAFDCFHHDMTFEGIAKHGRVPSPKSMSIGHRGGDSTTGGASRLRARIRAPLLPCSRVTPNQSIASPTVAPASRLSNTTETGVRVSGIPMRRYACRDAFHGRAL